MAPRINVLPESVANKIAAGEVVQRPASAVKELIENALDAGARSLRITVREGGKRLIQVADDGCGMDEHDALSAFLRHATSKISSEEDLARILTFGFRGEALASIAAVSRVKLVTRRLEDDVATAVQTGGGGEGQTAREAREPGTTVTVQNLFSSVPARLKFLKSPATEFRHVYEAVQRVALSHPEVAVLFVSDDETVFDLRPSTPRERVVDVFGERTAEALLDLEETGGPFALRGFIGKPSFGHRNRAHQFLYLNRRAIVNRSIMHAVSTGYEHLLTGGLFPFYLLFLETDPARVDVNVHPAKLEVKFEDEQAVHRFVASAVRKALGTAGAPPAISLGAPDASGDLRAAFTGRQHAPLFPATGALFGLTGSLRSLSGPAGGPGREEVSRNGEGSAETRAGRTEVAGGEPDRPLWQLHRRYILQATEEGVVVVDQHVAHERVLYERVMHRFRREARSSQQLLFPETLELTPGDLALVEELGEDLRLLGFEVRSLGKGTLIVDAVPPDVRPGNEKSILVEMLQTYREFQQHGASDTRDAVAKSYACRAAVKAGDPLSVPEMRSLLRDLAGASLPWVCPHGRPVMLRIPLDELDRRFGRI